MNDSIIDRGHTRETATALPLFVMNLTAILSRVFYTQERTSRTGFGHRTSIFSRNY
jgi:hypothetical protein